MQKRIFMKLEHLDFITFCVGSLADALHWSASRVYGTLRSTGLLAGYIIPCYDVLHTFSKEYMVEHPDVQHLRPNLDFAGASLPW